MRKCWACSPADRPTFSQLTTMVADVSVKPLPLIKKIISLLYTTVIKSIYFSPNEYSLDEHYLTNPNLLNSTTCAIDITKDVSKLRMYCFSNFSLFNVFSGTANGGSCCERCHRSQKTLSTAEWSSDCYRPWVREPMGKLYFNWFLIWMHFLSFFYLLPSFCLFSILSISFTLCSLAVLLTVMPINLSWLWLW